MASSIHTISLFVENVPGVLVRVASLFVRRGFNIESIAAGPTEHPEYTRITIVVRLEDKSVEQVLKQVRKLLPVQEAVELPVGNRVDRELILVRTALPPGGEDTIHEIAQRFQAHILDVSASSFLLESAAGPEEIDRLVAVLQKYGIQEMARTGCVALHRTPEKSLKQSPSLS
jgi:acetolactate synthase-1/3 small subunit